MPKKVSGMSATYSSLPGAKKQLGLMVSCIITLTKQEGKGEESPVMEAPLVHKAPMISVTSYSSRNVSAVGRD